MLTSKAPVFLLGTMVAACGLVPSSPLGSDIGLRQTTDHLEFAVALCPEEKITRIDVTESMSDGSSPRPLAVVQDDAGTSRSVGTFSVEVGSDGQLAAGSSIEVTIDTAFVDGSARSNGLMIEIDQVPLLSSREWLSDTGDVVASSGLEARDCGAEVERS